MARGRRPSRGRGTGGRSLTTSGELFYIFESEPPVDYDVVHILDSSNIFGRNVLDWEGATFCGAQGIDDPENGFEGSDGEVDSGHPVCPACVQAALGLEEQSVYLDSMPWEPLFVWNEDVQGWQVGPPRLKAQPTSPPGVRLRPARGLAQD
jgi:hypothetical protein